MSRNFLLKYDFFKGQKISKQIRVLHTQTYTDDNAEAISITLSINSGTLCGAGLDFMLGKNHELLS